MRRGRRRRPAGWRKSGTPRQPAPVNGIAAGRFGATWWGREWMAALERLGRAYANRLPRGRSYAREGRVIDLEVKAGHVTAGVVGSRQQPYRVDIKVAAFSLSRWVKAVDHLADDALLVARLLARELPTDAADTLRQTGIELFPSKRRPLDTQCTCPDVANPCKHVAAVHYVFAAALDNDPFLLLRLGGLDRDRLVAALGGPAAGEVLDLAPEEDELPPKPIAPPAPPPARTLTIAEFVGHDRPLPVVDVTPRSPEVELVGLKRLGPAPRGLEKLGDALAPFVRAAGAIALELAWWQPGDGAPEGKLAATLESLGKLGLPPNQPPPAKAPPRRAPTPPPEDPMLARVESVLGEAGEPISKRELVKRVGEDAKQVDEALQRLRRSRLVVATGRGAGMRYAIAEQKAPRSWKRRRRSRGKGGGVGAPAPMPSRILELLGASSAPMTVRDMAARLETTPDRLGRELAALRRSGVVEMVGRRRIARYRLKG